VATALVSHSACLDHETPPGHPESSDRLRAVLRALDDDAFRPLRREDAPRATREALARVHPERHIDAVFQHIPAHGFFHLDPDTVVSPGSGEAALRAAGAVAHAVDLVMAGEARNAFCAVRPPGHHAEPAVAMGFCLFNNVAVGALHARAAHGCARLAVVDFDVHHGNGTQALAQRDPDFFYGSTHQAPLYPGTGRAAERGIADNVVNMPLPPLAESDAFRAALAEGIFPALERFAPDFVLISAGFDGHAADPLAQLRLVEADFAWATSELCAIARRRCGGRVVSALEGGYDLDALARSAQAHVGALMAG